MNNKPHRSKKISELDEYLRKEIFLRGEVKILRDEIASLRKSKFIRFELFLKNLIIVRILRKIIRTFKKNLFQKLYFEKNRNFNKINLDLKLDIIIPTYKNLDLLRNLLKSLDINKIDTLENLLIVDDSGEPGYENAINQIINEFEIKKNIFTILRNESNLGFKSSVNRAWTKSKSEIVLLLNSDIELPKRWHERLLRPFEDAKVALATPLATNSGANLTLDLMHKSNWNLFDKQLSKLNPKFPDACTAIGYCLAIRKKSINTSELFSDEYQHGYGEDTDLHYRVKETGHKSVVIDNLLVWHKSGASYSTLIDSDEIKSKNAKVFHEKWGEQYQIDIITWNKLNPLSNAKKFSQEILNKNYKIDCLVVQLSTNTEIGGIQQLNSIYEEMVLRQMNVGTFFLNHDPSINVDGAKLVYFLHEIKKIECDKIIFSGIDSYEIIKKHKNLNKAKKINFLQGPDYLFPGNESRLHLFEESVKDSTKVIAQSPFLQNISDALGSITTTTVTLGPKQTIFFDQGLGKEKILLIPVRKDPDKGLRFILPAIKKIRAAGWKVVGFGDLVDNNLETYFDEFLGRITRTNLAKVFQKASLILDLSTYEGLGLIELEAGMCGVTSVINRKGGTDSLDRIKSEFIYIDNPLNFNEIVEKITQFDLAKANSTRSELASKFNLYSWENGIDQIISEIKKI